MIDTSVMGLGREDGNGTHVFTGLELGGNGAGPLGAVLNELGRSPLAVGVASSIDLEPLGARGVEVGASTVASSHVGVNRAHVVIRPLKHANMPQFSHLQ